MLELQKLQYLVRWREDLLEGSATHLLAERVEDCMKKLAQADIKLQAVTAEMKAAAIANNAPGALQLLLFSLFTIPLRASCSPLRSSSFLTSLFSPPLSHTAVPGSLSALND